MKQLLITLFLILIPCLSSAQPKRIINGDSVTSLEYPWMVELVDLRAAYREYFCGGALITPEWIVTAAHCLERFPCIAPLGSDEIEIVAGSYDLSLPQQRVKVIEIIRHPDYNCDTVDYDIALLRLETPVDLPTLRIAFSDPSVGTEVVTMGWGTMDPEREKNFPDILQSISMNIVSDSQCEEAYTDYSNITGNMICATSADEKGTCSGDSGSPLVVKKGEWLLAGITSWGWDECAVYPDVFTRVSQFTDFLKQHIPEIYLLRYDFNDDNMVGLQDAVYVIRSIAVENSGHDISDAIEILQVVAGTK